MGPALLRTDSPAAARASRADGRGGASRWRSVLAVLLVLLVAAGVALLWRGVHPQAPPEAPLPTYQFDQRAQPAPAPAPSPAPVPAYGPDRLGIPSLDIDAPLVPESVGAGGDLVIPGDPATVGRWREGPGLDAATGTTLLAGHVSVAGVGDGALRSEKNVLVSQPRKPPRGPVACATSLLGVVHEAVRRVPSQLVRADDQDVAAHPQHRGDADGGQRGEHLGHARPGRAERAAPPLVPFSTNQADVVHLHDQRHDAVHDRGDHDGNDGEDRDPRAIPRRGPP
jgi:hypothetical protein